MDYDQYLKEVKKNLNLIEKLSDAASGADERQNITNKILLQIASQLVSVISWLGQPVKRVNPGMVAAQEKNVTTAGTAEQLPDVKIPYDMKVVLKAKSTNTALTGIIYVGASKLEAEDHTKSFPLLPSETVEYKISNLNVLWLDAAVSGEGINWTVEQEIRND